MSHSTVPRPRSRVVNRTLLLAEELPCSGSAHTPFQHAGLAYPVDRTSPQPVLSNHTELHTTDWLLIGEHTGTHVDAIARFMPGRGSGIDGADEAGMLVLKQIDHTQLVDHMSSTSLTGPDGRLDAPPQRLEVRAHRRCRGLRVAGVHCRHNSGILGPSLLGIGDNVLLVELVALVKQRQRRKGALGDSALAGSRAEMVQRPVGVEITPISPISRAHRRCDALLQCRVERRQQHIVRTRARAPRKIRLDDGSQLEHVDELGTREGRPNGIATTCLASHETGRLKTRQRLTHGSQRDAELMERVPGFATLDQAAPADP